MRILHVIIGLHVGGAEMMLLKLLRQMDRAEFEPAVAVLTEGGAVAQSIEQEGIPVHHLGMDSVWQTPQVLARLRNLSRAWSPDIVQGWMYHGNVAASLAAGWSPVAPTLYWNIRHSLSEPAREKILTRGLIRLGARWSGQPTRVVHNSTISIEQHHQVGYGRDNAVMIANGFDLKIFKPSPESGAKLRAQLGLPAETTLVGALGRNHPMKAQADFIRAAALVRQAAPSTHFLLAGLGVTPEAKALVDLASDLGIARNIHLMGPQDAPAEYLAGLDCFCLSSTHGEGFPNVLGEAMACGVPCVTTDVGEAATIVGRWGEVVPTGNSIELADGIVKVLDRVRVDRHRLSQECRQSISTRYDIKDIGEKYAAMYRAG